jgi:hypothetical protein
MRVVFRRFLFRADSAHGGVRTQSSPFCFRRAFPDTEAVYAENHKRVVDQIRARAGSDEFFGIPDRVGLGSASSKDPEQHHTSSTLKARRAASVVRIPQGVRSQGLRRSLRHCGRASVIPSQPSRHDRPCSRGVTAEHYVRVRFTLRPPIAYRRVSPPPKPELEPADVFRFRGRSGSSSI